MMRLFILTLMMNLVPAHAAFLVEPYVGHEVGSYEESTNEGDATAFVHGFRLGYIGTSLISGVDFSLNYTEFDPSFLSENASKSYKTANVGFFAGLIYPRFKFSIGYLASSLQKKNGNPQRRTYFADTIKYSLGIRLFWRVFFNVEHLYSVYDEYEEDRDLTYGIPSFRTKNWQGTISMVWAIH